MRISLCGAAREVTGSGYLVETATARILVDFGMLQGSRVTEARNSDVAPFDPLSRCAYTSRDSLSNRYTNFLASRSGSWNASLMSWGTLPSDFG